MILIPFFLVRAMGADVSPRAAPATPVAGAASAIHGGACAISSPGR
jgi:hypothetical protein